MIQSRGIKRKRSERRRPWNGPLGLVQSVFAGSEHFGRPDLTLLAALAVLLILGINMVYSASFVVAQNSPLIGDDTYFLTRQIMWVGLGLVLMVIAMNIDYRRWRLVTLPFLAIVVLMLIAVAFVGHSEYGATRWLAIGPLPPVQPSEFAKLAVILYFSAWLSNQPGRALSFTRGTIPFAVVLGLISGLVLYGRDLGSTFIIVAIGLMVFFIGGANIKHIIGGLIVGGACLYSAIFMTGYRSDRVEAFLDPTKDPLGIGWHIIQTSIALGSGGLFGLGLGASRQKFYWLPNAHTDVIFAVIGEELGLLGTTLVVVLFLVLGYRGLRIMMSAPDAFGRLLAGGITLWILLQAFVNILVVTSLIPFTGVPLPFLSSGGSSMLILLAAVGILLNISRQSAPERIARRRERGAV